MALGIKDFTEPMPAWERREIERHRVEMRLFTLAHNLAAAGALCGAFGLGADNAVTWRGGRWEPAYGLDWHPGCGREAPGWRDE